MVGKTKTGKVKYYFSKNDNGTFANSMPEGFEIWEHPETGQVLLRKQRGNLFNDIEIGIIKEAIRKNLKDNEFKIDISGNDLIIYTSEEKKIPKLLPCSFYISNGPFMKMMKFTLQINKDRRDYYVSRWCFKGSIDDWHYLESSEDIRKLANKFCKHLEKDSFYELI